MWEAPEPQPGAVGKCVRRARLLAHWQGRCEPGAVGQPAKVLQNKISADWGEPANQEGLPVGLGGCVTALRGGVTVLLQSPSEQPTENLSKGAEATLPS